MKEELQIQNQEQKKQAMSERKVQKQKEATCKTGRRKRYQKGIEGTAKK